MTLPDATYWNEQCGTSEPLIVANSKDIHLLSRMTSLFEHFLPKKNNIKFLDLGCGTGCWMHYFFKEFGYDTSGVDYSEESVRFCQQNMKYLNVKSEIIHEDFKNQFFVNKYRNNFDVVFSSGLIEHFSSPSEIFKLSLELLKAEGFIVTEVPNFSFLNIMLTKLLNINKKNVTKKYLDLHNLEICNLKKFKEMVSSVENVQPLYLGYCGFVGLELYNWGINPHSLAMLNKKIKNLVDFLHITQSKSILSPSILLIGKKLSH